MITPRTWNPIPKPSVKKKAKKRIRSVSKKHGVRLREYKKAREEFLSEHRYDQFWLAERGLTDQDVKNDVVEWHDQSGFHREAAPFASEIHHKRGRVGKLLTDKTYFLAVSAESHRFLHDNPKYAYEKGYMLKR